MSLVPYSDHSDSLSESGNVDLSPDFVPLPESESDPSDDEAESDLGDDEAESDPGDDEGKRI